MKKIIKQISPNVSQEIFIGRIQSDTPGNKWEVYFTKTNKFGDEEVSSASLVDKIELDMTTPELQSIWNALESEILAAKQAQLDNPEGVTLAPDYAGFLAFLLSGNNGNPANIFVVVQLAVAQAPPPILGVAALSYSNFSTQMTLAVNERPNVPALQECLNNLISVLPAETDLTELATLFETYRIPLEIPNG